LTNRLQQIGLAFALLLTPLFSAQAQTTIAHDDTNPFYAPPDHRPFDYGVIVQGGKGLTEERGDFKFLMAGIHLGKTLTPNVGPGPLRGNFELAAEVFPFWQSYTPKFQRTRCTAIAGTALISCTAPYTVGGTFSGASITPVILRWNLVGTKHFAFWGQGAGGVLWTNHKYPAYGGSPNNLINDGPNSDASVFNFTPQGGVGVHYFIKPHRSIDFGANAIHISSASLGDRNPGVNASVQFTLGYSGWK
jgi:lipid A 3-O-deacylase